MARRGRGIRGTLLAVGLLLVVLCAGCVSAPPDTGETADDSTAAVFDGEYPLHTDIVATTFWVGEIFDPDLPDGSQVCSTYDAKWAYNWSGFGFDSVPESSPGCAGSPTGGCDGRSGFGPFDGTGRTITHCETAERSEALGFFPLGPEPRENPFYLDVPFDDLNDEIGFSERCAVIPWAADPAFSSRCDDEEFSFMKNRWVAITGPNGDTCYGQVQDAGPSHDDLYHDAEYVFGEDDVQPVQGNFNNAGMDVSPALNGCLGFADLDGESDQVAWRFVDTDDVPDGPWLDVVTNSGVTL
ncbi:MAG: hypothetical protein JWQ43_3250 [Glaciihabitans sp.]|nr:hypothetical protein [Glaciihabitans sp.]